MKYRFLLLSVILTLSAVQASAQQEHGDLWGKDVDTTKWVGYKYSYNPDFSLLTPGAGAKRSVRANKPAAQASKAAKGRKNANTKSISNDPNDPNYLPDHWNNAETIYFPPVFNQNGGSCGVASRVGYMMNGEINAYRGTNASLPENRLAPNFQFVFSYNGTSKETMAIHVGYPSAEVWGGFTSSSIYGSHGNHTQDDAGWMQGYDKWYHCFFNRISGTGRVPSGAISAAGREAMKRWLYNHNGDLDFKTGGILGIGCAAATNRSWTIGSCAHNDSLGFSDMKAMVWGSGIDHAATICGYDDRVWFDLDKNGVYGEPNNSLGQDERGAWIVVNSWGLWLNQGFAYNPYACATPTTSTVTANGKTCYVADGGGYTPEIYYVRKNYRPLRTIKLKIAFTQRHRIQLQAGISADTSATTPEKTISFHHFNYQGSSGNTDALVPMLGRWSDGKMHYEPMEFGYDLTDLSAGYDYSKPLKYFFIINSRANCTGEGEIHEASIMDYETDLNGVETPFDLGGKTVKISNAGGRTVISVVVWGEELGSAPLNLAKSNNKLVWNAPVGGQHTPAKYYIYKDSQLEDSTTTCEYTLPNEANGMYSVRAVYYFGSLQRLSEASSNVNVMLSQPTIDTDQQTFTNGGFTVPDIFSIKRQQFTIEYWIKPSSLSNWNQQIGPGWGTFMIHGSSDGRLSFGWNSPNDRITSGAGVLRIGQWTHVALVVDGNTIMPWINGAPLLPRPLASNTYNGLGGSNFGGLEFGSGTGNRNGFDGTIDELRIWGEARSWEDIETNRHYPLLEPSQYRNLLAYYKMDVISVNGVNKLRDCVGGHHAAFNNANHSTTVADNSMFQASNQLTATISDVDGTIEIGKPVQLNFEGSPEIISYTWTINDQTYHVVNPTILFEKTGTHHVEVTVNDGAGNSYTASKDFTVVAASPVNASSDFVINGSSFVCGDIIRLTSSNQVEGCRYAWSMANSTNASAQTRNTTTSYPTPGTYDIQLEVTAPDGSVSRTTKQIVIQNSAPIPDYTANLETVQKGNSVTFTDRSQYNPTKWRWDLIRGNNVLTQIGRTVSFTPTQAGTYNLTLTVSNEVGTTKKTFEKALVVYGADSGQGIRLDEDALTVNIANPEMTERDWTIDFWYRPTDLPETNSSIVSTNGDLDFHATANGTAVLTVKGKKIVEVPSYFVMNEWHHYAITYSEGYTVTFYRDGAAVRSARPNTTADWNEIFASLKFGTAAAGRFAGMIDELRVWNTALQQNNIKLYCVAPINPAATYLKAYYNFNEVEPTITDLTVAHNNAQREYTGPVGDAFGSSAGVFCLEFSADQPFTPTGTQLNISGKYSVVDKSDEEISSENSPATNAIDGNTTSLWHSRYSSNSAGYPHSIVIQRSRLDAVQSLRFYTNRAVNYRPRSVTVEQSDDRTTWDVIDENVPLVNANYSGILLSEEVTKHFIRITFNTGYGTFLTINEIDFYGTEGEEVTDEYVNVTYVIRNSAGEEKARTTVPTLRFTNLRIPDNIRRDYVSYQEVSGICHKDTTVQVTYTPQPLPFNSHAEGEEPVYYYYIKVDGRYFYNYYGNGYFFGAEVIEDADDFKWAIYGKDNYDGFRIVSKTDPTLALNAGTNVAVDGAPVLSTEPTRWYLTRGTADNMFAFTVDNNEGDKLFIHKKGMFSFAYDAGTPTESANCRVTMEVAGRTSTATFVVQDESGTEVARDTKVFFESAPISIPNSLRRDYVTLPEVSGTMHSDTTIVLTAQYHLPFEISTDEIPTYYFLDLNDLSVLPDTLSVQPDTLLLLPTQNNSDKYKWAFYGNPYSGFYLVNKAYPTKKLYAGAAPSCSDSQTTHPELSESNYTAWQVVYCDVDEDFGLMVNTDAQTTLYLSDFDNEGRMGYSTDGPMGNPASRFAVMEDDFAPVLVSELGKYFAPNVGTGYVGTLHHDSYDVLYAEYNRLTDHATRSQYLSLRERVLGALIPLKDNGYYRLINVGRTGQRYMSVEDSQNGTTAKIVPAKNKTVQEANAMPSTVFKFQKNSGTDTWKVSGEGLYITTVRRNGGAGTHEVANADINQAANVVIDFPTPGIARLCTQSTTDAYGYLHDNGFDNIVGWSGDGTASHWRILPAETLTLSLRQAPTASYASAYLPFPVTVPYDAGEQHTTNFYVLQESSNAGVLTLRRVEQDTLPANTAVLIRDVNGRTSISLLIGASEEPAPIENNMLTGYNVRTPRNTGIQTYAFSTREGLPMFYPYTATLNPANKAIYTENMNESRSFVLSFDDENVTSVIEQLLNEGDKDVRLYDVTGRRITGKAKHGIYILNGKKVYIK